MELKCKVTNLLSGDEMRALTHSHVASASRQREEDPRDAVSKNLTLQK